MSAPRTRTLRSVAAVGLLSLTMAFAACGTSTTASTGSSTSTASSASAETVASTTTTASATQSTGAGQGGPGNSVDVSSVSTVDELNALIQEAYGEASLGLHRGHQPVESTLNEVLGISHEELHARMDSGQNLATIANDVGVGEDKLIAALVDAWEPAIDTLKENGTITADQAEEYRAALKEAFTFKITWDGKAATPTFSGVA